MKKGNLRVTLGFPFFSGIFHLDNVKKIAKNNRKSRENDKKYKAKYIKISILSIKDGLT